MGSGYEIARAIQRCVAHGHDLADCWKRTPRQLSAWSELIEREHAGRSAELLHILRAAQSTDKSYKEIMKKLREFSQ